MPNEEVVEAFIAGQIAQALGITVERAARLLADYRRAHPELTIQQAAQAVVAAGAGGGGDGGGGPDGENPFAGGGGPAPSGSTGGASPSGTSGGGGGIDTAAAEKAFLVMLQNMGIPLSPEARQFVAQAVGNQWSASEFMYALRQTKFYAKAFPGIMTKNGTLRMSEAQYTAFYRSIQDYAAAQGYTFSRQAFGLAIKNGNSPSELRAKVDGLAIMRDNREVLQQFAETVDAYGLGPKKGMTRAELLRFVMRQGPPEWEQLWQTSYAAAQLENIGFEVAKGADISIKGLGKLIKQAESLQPGLQVEKLGLSDYRELATQVQQVIPLSKLYSEGLSKRDLIELYFGGKRAPELAERVKRVMATHQAFFEARAEPQLVGGPRGSQLLTGGISAAQATE